MSHRLRVAPERLVPGPLIIDGDDHHYLCRVRRLRVGDEVLLFDGAGREASAVVERLGPGNATLVTGALRPAGRGEQPRFLALLSLIKGDRMEGAIRQLTELGVDEIVPVQADRSVVVLRGDRARERRDRYSRVAAEAARQCGRASVPEIRSILGLPAALEAAEGATLKLLLWEGARESPIEAALPGACSGVVCLLSGPEGGFEDEEVARARAAGFLPVGLGPRLLRAETAPVAALAILGHRLGDLGRAS